MEETLGQRLRRLLDERHFGKSDGKVAKESGIDAATLARTLADETAPRFATTQKLADYCGVSVEYLLTGEGSPEPPPADLDEIRSRVDEAMELLESIRVDIDRQRSDGNH